jgi:hypothetical protein
MSDSIVVLANGKVLDTKAFPFPADIDCSALPISDPGVAGKLWIDPTGHLVVSAG